MHDEHRLQTRIAELEHQLAVVSERERLFRQVFDHLPMVLYVKDHNDRLLAVNKAYTQVMNQPAEAFVGKTTNEIFPADIAQEWKIIDKENIATGQPTTTETTLTLPDETQRTYQTTQLGMTDDSAAPFFIGFSTDVTAIRQNERALRESQTLLRTIIDNLPFILYINDFDGTYTLINKFAADIMGVTPADIVGKKDSDLFPPDVVNVWRQHNQELLASGKAIEKEEPVFVNNEQRTNLSIKFPIYDDQGVIIAIGGVSTDITERKRAEEEREALQRRIINAQQVAIRELSTPLIPITDTTVIMPLIGTIDSWRAQQVMEALLEGVAAHQANTVIVDITGIHIVDTQVADALIRAAQAVNLLGARVMLTGIQPGIAQTLVGLGIDLHGITTFSTLKAAIASVFREAHR